MNEPMKTAVVGCGAISDIYLTNMIHRFDNIEVVACCASHLDHALQKAEQYGIRGCTYEDILADDSIELVVILTPTPTHYDLIKRALLAGKHVYTEKTLTIELSTAKELLDLADEKGLYLGSAPDTFLGAALQTARSFIDAGGLGAVTSFQICANRNLDFLAGLFKFLCMPGGGICYDYGVYYLTALVSLLGAVDQVSAIVENRAETRINPVAGHPDYGQSYTYPNESLVNALIRMESGVSGTFSLNGDTALDDQALFILYGTKGILYLTDPNQFGGQVRFLPGAAFFGDQPQMVTLTPVSAYSDNCRGIGPAELVESIRAGRPCRAGKEMAYHILDVIEQMGNSSKTGSFVKVTSSVDRPEPFTTLQ